VRDFEQEEEEAKYQEEHCEDKASDQHQDKKSEGHGKNQHNSADAVSSSASKLIDPMRVLVVEVSVKRFLIDCFPDS
jgi:hypothetical protein